MTRRADAGRHLQEFDELLRGQAAGGRLGGGDEEGEGSERVAGAGWEGRSGGGLRCRRDLPGLARW